MAAVSEWIAREYFESLGFLVHQPTKYQVGARGKRAEEETDLLIVRLGEVSPVPNPPMLWTSRELAGVRSAAVSVIGWHTERFSPGVLSTSPEIFRFVSEESIQESSRVLGAPPQARLLCLSGLPASRELERESLELIRQRGVDGVILFRTMLVELMQRLDVKHNYEKSDVLQTLRIVKNYGLIKDPQLELFSRKRGRKAQP